LEKYQVHVSKNYNIWEILTQYVCKSRLNRSIGLLDFVYDIRVLAIRD